MELSKFICLCHCLCLCICLCHCLFFGQVMSPHHSDQMSQRSQVSRVALCMSKVKVLSASEWVSEWVSEWQGHLLSCFGQLKTQVYHRTPIVVTSKLEYRLRLLRVGWCHCYSACTQLERLWQPELPPSYAHPDKLDSAAVEIFSQFAKKGRQFRIYKHRKNCECCPLSLLNVR